MINQINSMLKINKGGEEIIVVERHISKNMPFIFI